MRRAALIALLLLGCGPGERSFEAPLVLGGEEVAPEVLSFGEIVYMQRCRRCHGQHGRGDGQYASSMDPRPADLTTGRYPGTTGAADGALPTDEQLRRVITEGIDGTGMAPQDLEGEPLDAVIAYLKTLAPVWREAPDHDVQ